MALSSGGGEGGNRQGIQRLWFPLEIVNSFQYLARLILPADNYWPAVVREFSWEMAVCKRMTRILSREGEEPRMSGLFFYPLYRGCCYSAWRPGWSPPLWEGPWGVLGPGGETDDGAATAAET